MSHPPATAAAAACPAAPADLGGLVGQKLGNYRLERILGRGRMGVVYLATDEALLRPTAVKVLRWSLAEANGHDPVQWFLAEARSVARINHPRVVQIYGAARHAGTCYLAMEYVPGESAEARLAAGPLPPAVATDMLLQAASALQAAHRSGVIHRDVKPANLLVGRGGVTKLGDFGMALGPAAIRAGGTHLRVGTPYYTAPEIWRGEAATPASDVYSLGATYFHLLTGRPPFEGDDVAAVERAHLADPVPDPRALEPALPAACAALLARALAKRPQERHASAEALLRDARRVLEELGAAPEGPPGRATDRSERMMDLKTCASLPDVKGVVLGDLEGSFVDAIREPDGEGVAAVMGFVSSTLGRAGEALGLGALRRISVSSGARACVVAVAGSAVVTARVEPARSLPALEKALDHAASTEV